MRCFLYARVSTDKQAQKDLSIPAQLQLMREYARKQDRIPTARTHNGFMQVNAYRVPAAPQRC